MNTRSIKRTQEYIDGMRAAGELARETLDYLCELAEIGVTTEFLDQKAYEYITERGAYPAPLNYHGFPKSICTSFNEVICHGIPEDREIKDGDILNIDVTVKLNGYHGDTSRTVMFGDVPEATKKLVEVTQECLEIGIQAIKPYGWTGDIGAAIQAHAHKHGYSVVEDFAGHGLGLNFHERPDILHFGRKGTGEQILPGMFFTVEPMINMGRKGSHILSDDWTAVTEDGQMSAQFEHTLYVHENGVDILT
jgi:methionyl aminopeptidase